MKNLIFQTSIYFHVLAGILALSSGLVAMTYGKKGGKAHLISGKIFYWSMAFIFITTIVFFVLYPTNLKYQFFLTIGIVSFYPNWSGKRILSMKKKIEPKWFDKLAAFGIAISGFIMLGYGVFGLIHQSQFGGFSYLFLIFGVVSLLNAYGDLMLYFNLKEAGKLHWFFAHAGKMIGAYSAALTAFCVNIVPRFLPENFPFLGYMALWVGPGVVFAVISVKIRKKYKIKMGVA